MNIEVHEYGQSNKLRDHHRVAFHVHLASEPSWLHETIGQRGALGAALMHLRREL
jgi:hypothetical protein